MSSAVERFGVERGHYPLLTLHRAVKVNDRESLVEILEGLKDLAGSHRIFPTHPRTQKQVCEYGLETYFNDQAVGIEMVSQQGYFDFLCLMKYARLVVTVSGGIQAETTALAIPA